MKWTRVAVAALGAGLGLLGWAFIRGRPGAPGNEPPAAPTPTKGAPTNTALVETIYDGKLGAGWEDWGWGRHELRPGEPARVAFVSLGGIVFHHLKLDGDYGAFVFRFQAPERFGTFLSASVSATGVPESKFRTVSVREEHVSALAGGWRQAVIPWSELNPEHLPFDRLQLVAMKDVADDWVLLDKLGLTAADVGKMSATAARRDVFLAVQCSQPGKRINPLIYGIADQKWAMKPTARRIGGNPITRLNWDLGNVWNVGSDWFFENASGGDGLWSWLDDAVEHGSNSALVVPTIGWVSKDTTSVGFPRSKLPPQRAYDPNRPEAGDGHAPDGKALAPPPPTQTSVEATPDTIARWVRTLRARDERRGQKSVLMYILDNEPTLWDQTHRDVHPEPLGYDELLDRTLRYGGAIRAAAPDALIAGPAEWGWTGYFYSAKDRAAGFDAQPDRRAHGGVPLIPWYLSKLAEQEQRTGTRILDALDVHFYPPADGVYGPPAKTDAATAAKRLRSTRALWDPTYRDESWIKEPVRLIPRLQEWVASSYPGRQVVLGEWSFGAESHISGGLAIAEALGRFGQLGLDAAFNWGVIERNSPGSWAYRAYRNYDGKGARFLDWSVPTRTEENVSLFASRSDDSKKLVLVLLNLEPLAPVNAHIDLRACGSLDQERSFVYTAESSGLTAQTLRAPNNGEIVALAPPYSITVLEISTTPPTQP